MNSTSAVRAAALAVGLAALTAAAQVPIIQISSQPYVPLTGATPAPLVARSPFTPEDEGSFTLTLPFSFPFMGQTYTSISGDSNGFVTLGSACVTGCFSSSTGLPSANLPNGLIAGFWEDMEMGGGSLRYLSGPGEVTIEWTNFEPYALGPTAGTVTFQVKLNASGTFSIHHGPMTGTSLNGVVGFEDAAGALGVNLISGCTNNCGINQWVPNTLFTMGEPNEADLGLTSVTISNLQVLGTGNWQFNLQGTIRNFGRTVANNFLWRAYLSTDRLVDAADLLVAQGGPVSMPITSNLNITSTAASTTPPPQGAYYVLIQVDPTNVVVEASEANNVGASADQYVSGTDLVAASVAGVASSGGGNTDPMQVNFYNRGTVAAGQVAFRLFLSTDTTLDQNDFVITTLTRAVSGGQTINESIPVTMPVNAPNGDFYYILQVDPANAVSEATETNNVAVSSGKVTVRRADLVAVTLQQLDTLTNAPTSTARFGEPVRLRLVVSNTGGANAVDFRLGLVLSPDSNLSLLSDTLVCEQVVPALNAGVLDQAYTIDCPLPLNGADGVALRTGQYYLYGAVDARGQIFESLETNNNIFVGPVRITSPGADLMVTNVTAPAVAGVGEIIPVVRTIRNDGNVDAPLARYRFVASANDIITADDIPLSIVAGPGAPPSAEGSVTLAAATGDTNTELLQLPGTMPAGAYYIGCIVDPGGVVPDLNRANNGLASQPVQVAGSSLRIVSAVLPDATVGKPYAFRLAALGEDGASTWTVTGQPAWLTLDAATGLLSGTPAASSGAEVSAFTVTLANRGRTSAARLVLRTLPPTAQVEITTAGLPSVINSSSAPFSYALGAAGGVRPYAWRLAGGALPGGLGLSAEGTLSGSPRGTPNGTTTFTVEVRDASGGRAQRSLSLRLVAPGAIVITKRLLPDALSGNDYLEDIAVENADGSGLAKPLTWRLTGTLPTGLSLSTQSELATISGRPLEAGRFPLQLTVEDLTGRSDTMDYVLVVHAPHFKLSAPVPELLRPGQAGVSVAFAVAPAASGPVAWSVAAGALPPGLTLSAAGVLAGTVAEDALGSYTWVVEAKGPAGVTGLGAFSTRVEAEVKPSGCGATGLEPLALLALAVLVRGRRRRVE